MEELPWIPVTRRGAAISRGLQAPNVASDPASQAWCEFYDPFLQGSFRELAVQGHPLRTVISTAEPGDGLKSVDSKSIHVSCSVPG